MNLSPLSFRIKKYPKDRSKQQRLSRRIKSQKKGLKWTTLETWIKTRSVNVQHCPSFSIQFRKTRIPNIVQEAPSFSTRVSICITEGRVTMEIGLYVV